MMLVKTAENSGPPTKEQMDVIGKLAEEAAKAGSMIETRGLSPTASAAFRVSGGQLSVIDGPFTEAKEVVGGYAVLELKSKQEAMESATRLMELHSACVKARPRAPPSVWRRWWTCKRGACTRATPCSWCSTAPGP